jgi:hypothetical protein
MTSTAVSVNTFTHSVTYVTDQILLSIRRIISWSELDPAKFLGNRDVLENGVKTWLRTRDLEQAMLEIIEPITAKLLVRWDIDVRYTSNANDDGTFWADTDAIKNAIKKCGAVPSECRYRILVHLKEGATAVSGWATTTLSSTDGLKRYCVGTTIGANSVAAGTAYWKRS